MGRALPRFISSASLSARVRRTARRGGRTKPVAEFDALAGRRGQPGVRPGANMMVLKRAITWGGESWTAGVDRVHVSHPAVAAMPHSFEATSDSAR